MNLPLSPETLAQYFTGKRRSPVYDQAVTLYKSLKLHADGDAPDSLIGDRRPNESDEVQAYRLKIWEPITRQTFSRVLQSLGKIRRSNDWSIKYANDALFPKVVDGERLSDYCEMQFPYYTSVTNWSFSVLLRSMLIDANCGILIVPLDACTAENQYIRPYPILFNADQIIDHVEGQYAVLRAADREASKTASGRSFMSDKYYVVTTTHIVPYIQQGDAWIPVREEIITHGLGYLPLIRPRGQYVRSVQDHNLYESRLQGMLPSMNEAVREYSDLQAAVVSHLFPERWEMATQECNECKGLGYIPNPTYTGQDNKSKQIVCPICQGLGAKAASSPYKKTIIRPAKLNLGEQAVPIPPFDYVKKDIETIKVMDDRWERHLYRALSAVNMQFLAQTPLSISGDAKKVDRDELNNFVYNVAEDLIYVMDRVYAITADYRYSTLYPDARTRRLMLPYISVPQQYDLLGADYYAAQLTQLQTSNITGPVVRSIELEYMARQFYDRPEIVVPVRLELTLDPLSGVSDTDKALRLTNGGVSKTDYIISCNISALIRRALAADPTFAKRPYEEQMAVLRGYVEIAA
jgi:hypothetical protein